MSTDPSTNGAAPTTPGHDQRGRFTKGNPGGYGNPFARRVAALRSALLAAVTADDIAAVARALLARAKAGDVPAARLLLDRAVNPWLFESLLATAAERNPIEMDGYKFIRNPGKIFAGMLDVLYNLRCLLMHGELVPDATSNQTYEPAYHLVRAMIRCLV